MSFWATILAAMTALRVNALRSVLAMLGVIIGVAAVIVMVSISAGTKQAVEDQIASLGANMLTVRPGSSFFGGRRGGAGTADPLTESDVRALIEEVPGVIAASGQVTASATLVAGGFNWTARVDGVNADYLDIRDWPVAEGRGFEPSEINNGRVVILGQTVVDELFQGAYPIGAQVRVRNVPFEVIGVLAEKGSNSWGQDQDDVVFAPLGTTRARLSGRTPTVRDAVSSIYFEVAQGEDISLVQAEAEDVLRIRRDIAPGAEDNFSIVNFADFIRARNEASRQLGLLLGVGAAVTLLVGGIGIMNIMLVSVTERTREIGLRMAVGGRRENVRNQFLMESLVLCLAGGIVGLVAGVGGTYAVGATEPDILVKVEPVVAAIAIGSSAIVGVVFGFYPAHQASRLNPIEALRFE